MEALQTGLSPYVIVTVAIAVLLMDGIWLGSIAEPLYTEWRYNINYGEFKRTLPFRLIPAILAYGVMIISLSTLVVPRIKEGLAVNNSLTNRMLLSLIWGGLWGLGVYGTFNFTNYAIIHRYYPRRIVVVDLLWGIFVGVFSSFVSSFIA